MQTQLQVRADGSGGSLPSHLLHLFQVNVLLPGGLLFVRQNASEYNRHRSPVGLFQTITLVVLSLLLSLGNRSTETRRNGLRLSQAVQRRPYCCCSPHAVACTPLRGTINHDAEALALVMQELASRFNCSAQRYM